MMLNYTLLNVFLNQLLINVLFSRWNHSYGSFCVSDVFWILLYYFYIHDVSAVYPQAILTFLSKGQGLLPELTEPFIYYCYSTLSWIVLFRVFSLRVCFWSECLLSFNYMSVCFFNKQLKLHLHLFQPQTAARLIHAKPNSEANANLLLSCVLFYGISVLYPS